jgi:hypothetical protein
MASYESELLNKTFRQNVVIRIGAVYFAVHEPDSGLTLLPEYKQRDGRGLISSLIVNPTSFDLKRISTTISNYSFVLLDKNLAVTRLVKDKAQDWIKQPVDIYVGRVGVGMDFSEYQRLPTTRIKKVQRQDNAYNIQTSEETDRMNKPIYNIKSRLSGSILDSTSASLTALDDISEFPSSGMLKIDDEFLSYSSKNDTTKTFSGLIRGELTSTPALHENTADIFLSETRQDNPITLLLELLTSGGGGGTYDVLQDGLAIDQNLIDIAALENIRDEIFPLVEFKLSHFNIENALNYIEDEILAPCNLRFTYSRLTSKLTLALIDRALFVDSVDVLDEDTITKEPTWSSSDTNIINRIEIDWDYQPTTDTYLKRAVYTDDDSISTYGLRQALQYKFKGIKETLAGQDFLDDLADRIFTRLANPTPEISVSTQLDKSLMTIGDKTIVEGVRIPASDGTLNFANELEVYERAINFETGDVTFKLAFTSYTEIRSCYIAPSDTIPTVNAQNEVELSAGRGDAYEVGWKMRLWGQ